MATDISKQNLESEINNIIDFSDCELVETHNGKTIQFKYKEIITCSFYKNIDGFAGREGGISCSLDRFAPKARKEIYEVIRNTPNLMSQFISYLEAE